MTDSWRTIGDAASAVVEKLTDIKTRQAIWELVKYLEHDERKDFESRSKPERRNHIYQNVLVVREWLKRGAS